MNKSPCFRALRAIEIGSLQFERRALLEAVVMVLVQKIMMSRTE